MMKQKVLTTILIAILQSVCIWADDVKPSISPIGTFHSPDSVVETTVFSGSAPIEAHFEARPTNAEGWTAYYEWRFQMEGDTSPYLIRYEETTDYTFTQAGAHRIVCYARFTKDDETIEFMEDYWSENSPLTVTVSESRLDFPNAFSPNGDHINDVFKAKEGWQSLVEFHAYIFNRWGQLLYEWTDPADGWDGTYNGHDVKAGVYFLLVKAKGADGLKYNIKRDVNLLRGYNEERGRTN